MYKGLGVEGYIDTQKVMRAGGREDLSFWSGRRVWVGLDLAQSDDNTAVSMVTVEGDMLYAKAWGFIPSGRIEIKATKGGRGLQEADHCWKLLCLRG